MIILVLYAEKYKSKNSIQPKIFFNLKIFFKNTAYMEKKWDNNL